MPPKKTRSGGKRKLEEVDTKPNVEDKPKVEHEPETSDEPPQKAVKSEDSASASSSTLDWLLSDETFELSNPLPDTSHAHGEIDLKNARVPKTPPPEDAGKKDFPDDVAVLRYPSSGITPFQNLVCAAILSKPLSHKLGLRTIQTLLNPPFGIRTIDDLDEAGYEGRRKVMWDARTQHKEKTASQLGDLVEGVRELCGDGASEEDLAGLVGVREKIKGMKVDEAVKVVEKTLTAIKGIGPGGVTIFLRRVQADWEEVFPYADGKSMEAAVAMGLVSKGVGAEELAKIVDGDRAKYVRLLDVLVGLNLEKKLDEAVYKCGRST
ncbi:hypothetical protein P7C73_g3963, partial [Tremellales sp. Uapishka_1]